MGTPRSARRVLRAWGGAAAARSRWPPRPRRPTPPTTAAARPRRPTGEGAAGRGRVPRGAAGRGWPSSSPSGGGRGVPAPGGRLPRVPGAAAVGRRAQAGARASAGVAAGAQAAPRWRGGRCVCRPVTRPYGAWWRGHRHPHARRAAVAGVPERRGGRAGRQQRWGRSCATAAGRPAGQACSACTSPPTGRPPRSAYGSSSLSRGTTFMPCSSWKRSLHAYGICSADTAAPVRQYWHQPL